MDDTSVVEQTGEVITETPTRTNDGRFLPGHRKVGGRKKGTPSIQSWFAREVAQSKGFNPISAAMDLFLTGDMPLSPGERRKKRAKLDDQTRVKILLDICKYIFPVISSVQVTGQNGGPVAVATLDMSSLLADPALARAAQQISLAATKQSRALQFPEDETQE
jgi:hypothetical protein